MFIVTLSTFSNLTVHWSRHYVQNWMLRTLHRSKHCWVQVWFLWRKRSFASTSVFVAFVAESLALIQVFSQKMSKFFFSFWDMWYFYRQTLSVFCPTPRLVKQISVFMTPGDRLAQIYRQALGGSGYRGFNSHTQNNCKLLGRT